MAELPSKALEKPPLDGITVIDMSRVLSGPYCTMVLADLGARVIKIERPDTGDDTRAWVPFVGGQSGYFMAFNRHKESIALDLKTPYDREILESLLAAGDVLVENFRPGVMDRLGYGYEALSSRYPRLVYASISGYGDSGPLSDQPAYDMIIQGMCGAMSLTGEPDGPPERIGPSYADLGAAVFASIGICAALAGRARTGRGQKVDISMLDCGIALIEHALARVDLEPTVPTRTGSHHATLGPFGAYTASDGDMVIAAANDTLFGTLTIALGHPELADDKRFLNNDRRVANEPALKAELDRILSKRTVNEWIEILRAAEVPCGPINTVDKVLQDPQLKSREMFITVDDALGNKIETANNPIRFSAGGPRSITARSPLLDEHREALVQEFMTTNGHAKFREVRQLAAGADVDLSFVNLAVQH
ncbi:MAG: CoA transferase [Caulobacteraceae bacterium]|nr:CoA transferase [Caulobacteraceae bacterium]